MLTGDPHDAADVTAEAFTDVWRRWQRGPVEDVDAYLGTAVINEIRDRARHRQVAARHRTRRSGDARGIRTFDDAAADREAVWQAVDLQTVPQGDQRLEPHLKTADRLSIVALVR